MLHPFCKRLFFCFFSAILGGLVVDVKGLNSLYSALICSPLVPGRGRYKKYRGGVHIFMSKNRILKYHLFSAIVIVVAQAFLFCAVFFYHQHRHFKNDVQSLQQNLISEKKELIRSSVRDVIFHIDMKHNELREMVKKRVRMKVVNVAHFAEHDYDLGLAQGKSRAEIEASILKMVGGLDCDLRGLYYVCSPAGTVQLDLIKHDKMTGLWSQGRASHLPDFQQLSQKIKQSKDGLEGFQADDRGYFVEGHDEISYIAFVESLSWFIVGTESVSGFEQGQKKMFVDQLNRPAASGGLPYSHFIYQFHVNQGADSIVTMLTNPSNPELVGQELCLRKGDVTGNKCLKEMLQGIREEGEAFVVHWHKELETNELVQKLGYFKLYPRWNWIVGKEVSMSEFDKILAAKTDSSRFHIWKEFKFFTILYLAAVLLSLLLSFSFTRKLTGLFDKYQARQDSLQNELKEERDKLEQRVEERTLELQKTTSQLVQSEKMAAIGRLSASIAHEINNPISGIRSVLDGIGLGVAKCLSGDDRTLLQLGLKECDRVRSLSSCLLKFGRYPSEVKEDTDINYIVVDLVTLVGQDLAKSGIEIELELADDLPPVHVVVDQIKQIFLNLINNARDAMAEGPGRLRIASEKNDVGLVVRVSDTGPGIKPGDLNHVFEPFFTTKAARQGTGLGLAISYAIAQNNGGWLTVESEAGQGAIFSLFLPSTVSYGTL